MAQIVPAALQRKLDDMGFVGNFLETGVSVTEALGLEAGSLMRRINEETGVHKAFADAKEAETLVNNANPQPLYVPDAPIVRGGWQPSEQDATLHTPAPSVLEALAQKAEAALEAAVQTVEGEVAKSDA